MTEKKKLSPAEKAALIKRIMKTVDEIAEIHKRSREKGDREDKFDALMGNCIRYEKDTAKLRGNDLVILDEEDYRKMIEESSGDDLKGREG